MKKKKVTAQAKLRMIVFGPLCIISILYFLFFLCTTINDIIVLEGEKKERDNKYLELREDTDYLENRLIKLKDPEELAKYAREMYYYSKDGELIIKLDDNKKEKQPDAEEIKDYRVLMYISATIVVLIFTYIFIRGIKKNKK